METPFQGLLPHSIQVGITTVVAYNPTEESDSLSMQAKMVLCALLRCADAKDLADQIRVRKSALEDFLKVTSRTIYRILDELEEAGWIDRQPQHKSRQAGFGIGIIHLGSKLVSMIQSALASSQRETSSPAKMSHACSNSKEQFSLKRQSQAKSSPKAREKTVPEDCQSLSKRMSIWAIFKLMGLARKQGKKLGDIVACKAEQILKAKNPYAFTRTLIDQEYDYAWSARQTQIKVEQKRQQEETKSAFDSWLSLAAGRKYSDPKTGRVYVLDRPASVFEVFEPSGKRLGSVHSSQMINGYHRLEFTA